MDKKKHIQSVDKLIKPVNLWSIIYNIAIAELLQIWLHALPHQLHLHWMLQTTWRLGIFCHRKTQHVSPEERGQHPLADTCIARTNHFFLLFYLLKYWFTPIKNKL